MDETPVGQSREEPVPYIPQFPLAPQPSIIRAEQKVLDYAFWTYMNGLMSISLPKNAG